jgi:hypothetical protein
VTSSNSRRQPPVRIAPAPPPPPPPPPTWQERLRGWWHRFLHGPDALPPPAAEPPAPVRIGYDVLAIPVEYRCSVCGGKLLFEIVASETGWARSRHSVGACIKSSCQMRDVRLRIPLQVIANCEIVE